jgi:tripartite-type tricarboxylate transporter receptor subunit TctC
MKLPHRRKFLHLAAGAAALPVVSGVAWAQTYPARPVRIIIGVPAGGTGDILARLIGQSLQERLGQPFIVENRPGAGTNLAIEAVVRASPDGYTLLLTGPSAVINATLYEKLNYNFIRDIAPVAGFTRVPNVMVVHPSVPAKTVPELIAYTKANPGKLTMASNGNGLSGHVAGELFKMMAGVNMLHVPYRGEAPAFSDLLSGQVQVMFGVLPGSLAHIRDGRLRALAVTSSMRSEALPDVPTVADFLPGYESSVWFGFGLPKDSPSALIDKLNKEINEAIVDPKIKARFADFASAPMIMTPAEFGRFISDETEKWGRVVKFSGAKVD